MNNNVLFVRVMGMLVPVSEVMLVQVNPNNHRQVVQEMPLTRPLGDLARYNLTSFVKVDQDRNAWIRGMHDGDRSERG